MEDLSGYEFMENDWLAIDELPDTLIALLSELGKVYVPYLLANAEAVQSGADRVETTLDGRVWQQNPFAYQAKCLKWIRNEYQNVDEDQKSPLSALLDATDISRLIK